MYVYGIVDWVIELRVLNIEEGFSYLFLNREMRPYMYRYVMYRTQYFHII